MKRTDRFGSVLSWGCWFLGVITVWLAIYTGILSYHTEVRRICDPAVLKTYRLWEYYAAYLYTAGLAVYAINRWARAIRLLTYLAVLITLAGAAALTYSGHLGASLVYQQGAGMRQPAADCCDYVE